MLFLSSFGRKLVKIGAILGLEIEALKFYMVYRIFLQVYLFTIKSILY